MNNTPGLSNFFSAFLIGAVTTLVATPPLEAADAVTVEEPNTVCPNDEFDVEWTGPDGAGDRIMINDPDDPAGMERWDFAETSEGNPVTLTAPNRPGHYKKRYFVAGSESTLEEGDLEVIACETGVACELPAYPPDEYAVAVHAIQSSSGTQYQQPGGFSIGDLCAATAPVLPMVSDTITRAESPLGLPTAAIQANITAQVQNAREAICAADDEGPSRNWATFVYSHCRLAGQAPGYSMDIHIPPGTGNGTMKIADHNDRKVIQVTLKRNVNLAYQGTGTGWSSAIQMKQVGSGTKLGYPVAAYEFAYQMGMGVPGLGELTTNNMEDMAQANSAQALGNFASIDISGTAWLAQCIPGIDIVRAYHNKLTREVQPYDGTLGAFGGIIQNQVAMLEHGMPLDIVSSTTGKVAGMQMMSSNDRNVVVGFDLVEMPGDWCTQSLMPADYEVIDIDEQVNEALRDAGRSGSGGGAESSAEMNQAMEEMNRAMEQLTPEQRQMMEQFGLGSMMQQANPAGQPAVAPGGSGVTSQSLTTDDMTQSVQLHLQALGYDPGNTDGELSTETVIAISQFQAERGMKVTGEVTPQLLGILGAAVDTGR